MIEEEWLALLQRHDWQQILARGRLFIAKKGEKTRSIDLLAEILEKPGWHQSLPGKDSSGF